jgi:hypothetical protein
VKLRNILFVTMASAVAAFAQNPITADSTYQIRYASNLNIGDSVVNISNTGARGGVTNQSGTSATVGGAICANVYAFDPQEEIVSCCSCPVTPNGLVSLSAKADLVINPLFARQTPNSIVIKLVASVPVGGSCAGSAQTVTTPTTGLVAWGTTLHAAVAAGTYAVTETAFTPATLSASELARLTSLCTFANQQGSGAGLCNSCRLGGLGASKL